MAATVVVLVHIALVQKELRISSFLVPIPQSVGGLAVTFFFVLSGFLITYLLLHERAASGTVDVGKFYWRRILRIWPLYYLILFLAFVFLNNRALLPSIADPAVYKQAPTNIALYLVLLPSLAFTYNMQILYANQLWSVGVEEQFYLVWPLFMKRLGRSGQFYSMLALVVGFVLVRNGTALLIWFLPEYDQVLYRFIALLTITRIDCMAIGGLGAYALYYHPQWVHRFISSVYVDIVVLITVLVLASRDTFIPYIHHEFYSVLFCYVILSGSCKPGSILQLKGKTWDWLGKLSYGIYMWHMAVIALAQFAIKTFAITQHATINWMLYTSVVPATILVSWLSYQFIEQPFLKIKSRFVVVKSCAA
ncbi:acyltransferase [Hymenobacter cellulosilyticus]|uniref:Acyltransferase n=1 Tax=Hymenobacter cellulosilyticus TaxID=2932248 RepID=A0A8T9Q053_9BACT|nr:acyltransferase [Hymenobacter cellulosilyticus]